MRLKGLWLGGALLLGLAGACDDRRERDEPASVARRPSWIDDAERRLQTLEVRVEALERRAAEAPPEERARYARLVAVLRAEVDDLRAQLRQARGDAGAARGIGPATQRTVQVSPASSSCCTDAPGFRRFASSTWAWTSVS